MHREFKQELLLSVGIVLASFAVSGFVLWWIDGSMAENAGKIAENRLAFQQYSQTIDLLADLKRAAPAVKKEQDAMNLLLPKKDDLVEFSRWLDGVSRVNKVSVDFGIQGSTAPAKEQEAGSYGFTLGATGSSADLQRFFRELELRSNRFLVSMDSFDFTGGGGSPAHAVARGRVFFR